MKAINSLLFAASLMLLLPSCQKIGFKTGEEINFNASASPSVSTKSEYSGEGDDIYERINWCDNDLIRIYCPAVSEPVSKYAEYRVDVGSVQAQGTSSLATVFGLGGIGLRWGADTDDHVFYAVYPSPLTNAKTSTDVFPGPSGKETVLTATIPAVQKPVRVDTGGSPDYLAVADMTSEYMVAKKKVPAGSSELGTVFLTFKPIVTAIEFNITLDNSNTEDFMKIKEISLISDEHNICGSFTADLSGLAEDGSSYPVCKGLEVDDGGDNTVTMDLTDIDGYNYAEKDNHYFKLEKSKTMRLTFFLLPDKDVDDLTFKVTMDDGSWVSTKLAYKDMTGVKFSCHKKCYVSGLLVPDGAVWVVKYAPGVYPWDTSASEIDPAPDMGEESFVTSWNKGIDEEKELIPDPVDYVCFSAPTEHVLSMEHLGQNDSRVLFYSYDKQTWTSFDYKTDKFQFGGTKGNLYIRGENEFEDIQPQGLGFYFVLKMADAGAEEVADVDVSGNIMALANYHSLDMEVVDFEFDSLFHYCDQIKSASKLQLPARNLAIQCYASMFEGCTSLETAPELPATNLADFCYIAMFCGCTSLKTAPELRATNLVEGCYCDMFEGCTSLETAPELPATNLAALCYIYMFCDCTNLKTAPKLPATILFPECYEQMFTRCTSLEIGPELPATNLALGCYGSMFLGCTKLNKVTMLATDVSAELCLSDWLDDVSSTGELVKAKGVSLPVGRSGIPKGWTITEVEVNGN